MPKEKLWKDITKMAEDLMFADCGCAPISPLSGSMDENRYLEAEQMGHFGKMEYLKRNVDKRMDPALLLPGAKSVIVFLAPFGIAEARQVNPRGAGNDSRELKISEFAFGLDYHTVIKDKLFRIASHIEKFLDMDLKEEVNAEKEDKKAPKNRLRFSRVFTDSAPVMERAWAVRAGLGFIGKNNFLISPKAGIKNFLGIIITAAELPYPDKTVPNGCGQCTRCLDACTQKALYAPYKINASKCLSYKTIEAPLEEADKERTISGRQVDFATISQREKVPEPVGQTEKGKWIFGCDDCMNACPWNRFNKDGWEVFRIHKPLYEKCTREFWEKITEEEFNSTFKDTPLMRAGLDKIKNNISQ